MNISHFNEFERNISSHDVKFIFSVGEETKLYVEVVKLNEENDVGLTGRYRIMPIEITSTSVKAISDIILSNEDNVEMGFICFKNKEVYEDFVSLTIPQYICSIVDSELNRNVDDSCLSSGSYTPGFSRSYLLLNCEFEVDYVNNLQKTAPLWGGFSHEPISSPHSNEKQKITAIKGLHIPTSQHSSKLIDAINSSNGFDRFLKKYHLLELLYDYICVLKLKTISPSIKEFRNIMLSYDREEISSLKNIINDYVDDIQGVINSIYNIEPFITLANNIFQNYSKESNPLKDNVRWDKILELINEKNISYETYKSKFGKNLKSDEYKKNILDITAYWVYRIRCSIAHNKIGEFIFDIEQEDFVVDFGEALIDEITKQIFSNSRLIKLFNDAQEIDDARISLST